MSINLLELLTKQLGGDSTLGMIGNFLGEDKQKTGSALSALLPSVLGGLMSKASTPNGAGQIFDALSSNGFDGTLLNKVGDVFGGGEATNGILNKGGGLADMIFGNKLGGITDLISSVSGIGKGSSSSLLKLGLPLVMSLLGKTKNENNLSASGLASLLMGQKDHIAKAAPAGLSSLLGFASFDDLGKDVKQTVSNSYESTSSGAKQTTTTSRVESSSVKREEPKKEAAAGGGLRKLLPLLLLALLGFLLWPLIGKGCMGGSKDAAVKVEDTKVKTQIDANATRNNVTSGTTTTTTTTTTDATGKVIDATGNAAKATVDATGKVIDATGNAVNNAAQATGNAVNKATQAVGNAATNVAGFFTNGGKAGQTLELSGIGFDADNNFNAASEQRLAELAKLLKANPNINITIEAFADTGKPLIDKVTGKLRAERIEAKMKDLGIPVNRIRAIGKTGANKVVITQQ